MAESIILLRHGQTGANRDGRWHGSTDTPLTWRGRRQAKRTAKTLLRREVNLEAIYASPLQRCQTTAAPSAKSYDLETTTHAELREWSLGDWEGTRFDDLAKEHRFYERVKENPHFTPPAGESLAAVADRMVATIRELDAEHEGTVLIVSHGAAMATAMATILDDNAQQWPHYLVDNCALTELVLEPVAHAVYFNRSEHL